MKLEPLEKRGKFIVLYGANNLGKSTQMKLLASRLIKDSRQLLSLKYPIYGLEPTGPIVNDILRGDKVKKENMTESDVQKVFAQNRRDFQDILITLLNSNINIAAEDYTHTGTAWGMTRGLDFDELRDINKDLLIPDLEILMDGERFLTAIEKNHRNENSTKDWNLSRDIYKDLAKIYEWPIINANQSIESVHNDIWKYIERIFS